jgi:hypothetical protein
MAAQDPRDQDPDPRIVIDDQRPALSGQASPPG